MPAIRSFIVAFALAFFTTCQNSSLVPAKHTLTSSFPPIHAGDITISLPIQAQLRHYLLHIPQMFTQHKPLPLVLVFHGYGGQGKDLPQSTGLSHLADRQGFIVAYPDGVDRRWHFDSDEDVKFTAGLIDQLQHHGIVSRNQVYAVGISNGGFLIHRLACKQPDRIAAFAAIAASLPTGLAQDCQSQAQVPVSMLMINGTDDRKVPWLGGIRPYGSILSIPKTVDFWRQHNQCSSTAKTQILNSKVQIDRYQGCRSNVEVEFVTLKGVGHLFPRGGGGINSLIDGAQEAWQFFRRHRLNRT